MLLIIKKVVFLVGLTLYIISAHSQTVTSMRNGVWNDPDVWSSGTVPTSLNATGVVIDHEIELPTSYVVSVFNLVVNNKLTLRTTSELNILPDALPTPDLAIIGTLVKEEGAILNGTTISNTTFAAGSFYVHQQGPLGFIPYATWDKASTFVINGFKDSGYINIAHSDSWKQTFGNVVYDCPQQSIFVVDLNGYLRNIAGDFTIKSTNNKTLRLSTTQNPTITIGGGLIVEGPSELWFSTNGTSTVVNIQKDFNYTSTSGGPSYLTTRGMISVNVNGNFIWSSTGPLRMASSSADSLGLRRAVINLRGNLSIGPGVMLAPPLGSGNGRIVFNGTGLQSVNASATGASFLGNLDYMVDAASVVDLGMSAFANTTGSLQVFGTLRVGSTDPMGAIQLTNNGNIRVNGTRRYEPGSTISYNGSSDQWIGNGHPLDPRVNLMVENPTITTLRQDVLCRDLILSTGSLSGSTNSMSIYGNASAEDMASLDVQMVRFEGNQEQTVALDNISVGNVSVNKPVGSVTLDKPLSIGGILQIESTNTTFRSNGYLTLLSTSDDASNSGRIGPLPAGSGVTGDVTVQRYMSAEGRIFRYISSPVREASVASLMDDFAITGRFADPTTGGGVNSKSVSFYYYDESDGNLQRGWRPYPVGGLAQESPLEPGRGYCALIRPGSTSIVWDVKGTLNQGEVELPVAMTPNMAPSNGWNLVGNPYACTIDWDLDGNNGWTKENISPIICIRDNGIGSWGNVRYWDGDNNYTDIPEGRIAAGQSFWVKATGANPRLIAREGIKVTNDASFYRAAASYIPSFVIVLQKDGYIDKTYYKVRPGAHGNYDMWDAMKMDNENFDISTLSDDGFSLAINSQDSLPCGDKIIQLLLKDVRRGIYKIRVEARHDFNSYNYALIDNYLQTTTPLLPGGELSFDVSDDPMSKSSTRFALRLNEIIPTDSLLVTAPLSVCNAETIQLSIQNAEAGVFYSIWENERCLSDELMGNGGNISINIRADSVEFGSHEFYAVARSACRKTKLTSTVTVAREGALLSIPEISACQGERVTLAVQSNSKVLDYFWFDTEISNDTLGNGAIWTTPSLFKSKTYFVSASLSSECDTERIPVPVQIVNFDPAAITVTASDILSSNYLSNNQWLFNGVQISYERELRVEQSGMYVLIADSLGCKSYDTLDFICTSMGCAELPDFMGIDVFPNPVNDFLKFPPIDYPMEIDIVDGSGRVCNDSKQLYGSPLDGLVIDVKTLRAGAYFAVIRAGHWKRIIKFIKTD